MDTAVEFSQFIVENFNVGDNGDKADITFEYNGKRIVLSIYYVQSDTSEGETSKSTCLENRLIRLLSDASDPELELYEPEDDEYYKGLLDEVAQIITEVGKIPFSQVAPPLKVPFEPPRDLHHKFYPETFDFRLQTIHDTAFVLPISPKEAATVRHDARPDPNLETDFQPDPSLPRYSSKEVMVLKQYWHGLGVRKVQVGSQVMLCKAIEKGLEYSNLKQELINLQKISKAFAESDVQLRIPLVRGYVTHAETGAIIGLLRDWIPPGRYGNTLADAGRCMASIPVKLRRKWFRQITETLDALHSVGIFWSDGKAANVCLDPDDNIWLIDFAGGWTQAWVNKTIAGTKEGDEHAILKLKAFLHFNCPEISPEEKRRIYSSGYSSYSEMELEQE
ncbi:hypothetical protein NM208_g836 [Fusarium decemcellulare]|uniref:Uncharacterized protein n=1 Tax=Fusarium decemcellulare TaxID=57161 RepID=A0ACC1SYB1_9HYPO|nr:hypothetical protein NM208_g836 [Fusarium decemcellulare]